MAAKFCSTATFDESNMTDSTSTDHIPVSDSVTKYSPIARFFHWLTVLLLILLIPSGMAMTYRGDVLKIWDPLTNALYSSHKVLGLLLLAVVVLRVVYRLIRGAPEHEESLSGLQRLIASVTHVLIYWLLLAIPVVGWMGISLFPALDVFGIAQIPPIAQPDREMSEVYFEVHKFLGNLLLGLIALHVTAALVHHLIWRDGVMRRMWPKRLKP